METNRRSWLFNAAIRQTLGLANPHEGVQDEYSYLIEDHVDFVASQIIKNGAEDVWKDFNLIKWIEKLDRKIERFQSNLDVVLNDPERVFQILVKEVSRNNPLRDELNKGDIFDLIDDERIISDSSLALKVKASKNAIEDFKKEKEALLNDSLRKENLDLIAQYTKQKPLKHDVA